MRGDAFAISDAETAFSAQLYYLIHVFDRIIKFGSKTCFPVDEPTRREPSSATAGAHRKIGGKCKICRRLRRARSASEELGGGGGGGSGGDLEVVYVVVGQAHAGIFSRGEHTVSFHFEVGCISLSNH